jgi:hypothetical protein
MNSSKSELVLTEDGKIIRRVVNTEEYELDVQDSLVEELAKDVVVRVRDVATIPGWGRVHLSAKPDQQIWWTIEMDKIHLKSHYTCREGVATPLFAKQAPEPLLPLVWKAPEGVNLKMLVNTGFIRPDEENGVCKEPFYSNRSYLFAFDKGGRCWRLPLTNLFDDCKLCLGRDVIYGKNSFDTLTKTLVQFADSQWNSDLSDRQSAEQIEKFFRFKPTDSEFETLPILAEDWTTLCKKIATPEMENVV